ncbi:hypothetical protein MBLNU230_g1954t1 [Neophaeotheca triangularis]
MPTPNENTPLYTTLQTTAKAFIHALRPSTPNTNHQPSPHPLEPLCTPTFTLTFGPTTNAPNPTPLTLPQWLTHISTMVPQLQTGRVDAGEMAVDDKARRVVVRAWFEMVVAGGGALAGVGVAQRTVGHEVAFWLGFEHGGARVESAREVLDAGAVGRIGDLVKARAAGEGEREGKL